jgi:hypothetical protein
MSSLLMLPEELNQRRDATDQELTSYNLLLTLNSLLTLMVAGAPFVYRVVTLPLTP